MRGDCRFAVDLLWLRVGKNGGSESYIRNILDGMQSLDRVFEAYLIVSKDNKETFTHYQDDPRFIIIECPIESANIKGRMFWQNFHLRDTVRQLGLTKCFEPIYSIPFIKTSKVDFYTVIHDLQAKHFPQYFSKARCIWMDISWRNAIKKSKKVITISNFAKDDIQTTYKVDNKKIVMIHNPIAVRKIDKSRCIDILKSVGVDNNAYFLCISSLLPHKNLEVLIRMMSLRADEQKLVIVGVGGTLEDKLHQMISERNLTEKVLIIPFVSDETRDALYACCSIFLFPSLFEGFGMPPVEAMLADKPVITTKCTSIPEVTRNEAIYVEDPNNENELNQKINQVFNKEIISNSNRTISSASNPYLLEKVADKYLDLLCT